MLYRALADFVVLVHLGFIIFVVFGGLLALRWGWVPWLHLPAALWGAAIEFFGWFCPLTHLENRLHRASGAADYTGGFIERYLLPLIYPVEFTRELQLLLGVLVVGVNVLVYGLVLLHRMRRAHRQ
ncbi:MAG: DUF2784 domain-containing protein [Gammaproteobacteria bacterium]|nr:DUF2784 domain-containing protein [Gammaproteobacteria bacterium]